VDEVHECEDKDECEDENENGGGRVWLFMTVGLVDGTGVDIAGSLDASVPPPTFERWIGFAFADWRTYLDRALFERIHARVTVRPRPTR
jgi:hypothetical protein